MINRRDDTPKTVVSGQWSVDSERSNQSHNAHNKSTPLDIPFGASTDAPLEDLPVPGDSHSKHSYYYDDATNYKVFNPDEDEE